MKALGAKPVFICLLTLLSSAVDHLCASTALRSVLRSFVSICFIQAALQLLQKALGNVQ